MAGCSATPRVFRCSISSLSARAEKGGERLSHSSPSRSPGLPYALPPPTAAQPKRARASRQQALLLIRRSRRELRRFAVRALNCIERPARRMRGGRLARAAEFAGSVLLDWRVAMTRQRTCRPSLRQWRFRDKVCGKTSPLREAHPRRSPSCRRLR